MARKNEYDKFIISASEVGTYVVCPESWRLAQLQNQTYSQSKESEKGEALHDEWALQYGKSVLLARNVRMIVSLLLLCILLFMMFSLPSR